LNRFLTILNFSRRKELTFCVSFCGDLLHYSNYIFNLFLSRCSSSKLLAITGLVQNSVTLNSTFFGYPNFENLICDLLNNLKSTKNTKACKSYDLQAFALK